MEKKTKKKAKKKGAPSKYTPDRIKRILNLIRVGNFKTVAARTCGISSETLSQWEKNKTGFTELIKEAENECEAILVARINKASMEQWQAAAWMLERKNYGRWGRKEGREISGSLDVTSTPEKVEEEVVDLYRDNPTIWNRIKGRVENE